LRILGIDPGLTRCGVGIVDVDVKRNLSLVDVFVIKTAATTPLAQRLLALEQGLTTALDEHKPDRVAIERVFAQHNVRTVMGVAQVSGIAIVSAAARDIAVEMHTPSEVKAAVSGSGRANKQQVAAMVARLLNMSIDGLLPDATDALALAITNAWRGGGAARVSDASAAGDLTPAQQKWRDAERLSRRRG
jgi:crossover junction endodeoxyribonuclease RuvC